jgi:hypothetical protein
LVFGEAACAGGVGGGAEAAVSEAGEAVKAETWEARFQNEGHPRKTMEAKRKEGNDCG